MEFRASQQMQGGTKEIIRDKENGVLLSQNITANELTKKITDFCKLDSYQYKKNRMMLDIFGIKNLMQTTTIRNL